MIKIDYPDHRFRMKVEGGREMVFDELRKLWLVMTPEEWVRQHFVQYLLQVMKYPSALIALEKKLMLGEMIKRFDILVYDRNHAPWMMVECKSMNVALNDRVLSQLLRYNIAIPVPYLVITNGTNCIAFRKEHAQLVPLHQLPDFENDQGKMPSSA